MQDLLEIVIVRSKLSKTLYDVVEIDMNGEIVNYIVSNTEFEQAQKYFEEFSEPQQGFDDILL
jgi:hypothetical protein